MSKGWRRFLLCGALVLALNAQLARAEPLHRPWGHLPVAFEANKGQSDPSVRFLARSPGYALFLTHDEAVLVMHRSRSIVRMHLAGANRSPDVKGGEPLSGTINYLRGRTADWVTSIPRFARVSYSDVYPGIDLVYYGNGDHVEFDFVVAAGADPRSIALEFDGAVRVSIDAAGDAVLAAGVEEIRLRRPVIYQAARDGTRTPVDGRFTQRGGHRLAFEIGSYDPLRSLVIDPQIVYSTYLGGDRDEIGHDIAVDPAGYVYVTGSTDSSDFPESRGSSTDAFVAKLNPTGTSLIYATYFGTTSNHDEGRGIAVDSRGSVYVAGYTSIPSAGLRDFPTTPGALQPERAGAREAFVVKLDPSGSGFVYSTLLGGSDDDEAYDVSIDSAGNAYVTGETSSADFDVTDGALRLTYGGNSDAFVAKLNATGSALVYSTYLGAESVERGESIDVDGAGQAYITGTTLSTLFPTTLDAYQPTPSGGGGDAFVVKLAANGQSLVFGTFLGGALNFDVGHAIAVGDDGAAHVVGRTSSSDFPVQSGHQPAPGGDADGFIATLSPSGNALLYASYIGGSGWDEAHAVALAPGGHVYVTGETSSPDFRVVGGLDDSCSTGGGCSAQGLTDAFVVHIDTHRSGVDALLYSRHIGGGSDDIGSGIAVDSVADVYVTGFTKSANFPTPNGLPHVLSGASDAIIVKLGTPKRLAAWGDADHAQIGDGFYSQRLAPVPVRALNEAAGISAGDWHNLVVTHAGSVWAWGLNNRGQLGFPITPDTPAQGGFRDRTSLPGQVRDPSDATGMLTGVTAVAAGLQFSIALKRDGTVWTWGSNDERQLGDNCADFFCASRTAPGSVRGLEDVAVRAIAAGERHGLALAADGTVWAWGRNSSGQLGDGCAGLACVNRGHAEQIADLTDVVAIASGALHAIALKSDGTVWGWGSTNVGQLGSGCVPENCFWRSSTPIRVQGLDSVVAIAAGAYHNLALRADGTLWAWGANESGQLGDGTVSAPHEGQSTPVRVTDTDGTPLTGLSWIAAGGQHSLAVKTDGSAWAWGRGWGGQLGDGTWVNRHHPVRVRDFAGGVMVDGGAHHSLAALTSAVPNAASNQGTLGPDGGAVATVLAPPSDTLGATVEIPAGVLAADAIISITELANDDPSLPNPPINSLSRVFQIGPEGFTFAAPVDLIFHYDDAELAGRDEKSLVVTLLAGGEYVIVNDCPWPEVYPCVDRRDLVNNTIKVRTDHFSTWLLTDGPPVAAPDTVPPTVTVAASHALLWPANHKLVEVTFTVTALDAEDPAPAVTLLSVVSSEPDDAPGAGDGATIGDIQGAALRSADHMILLRAERDARGTGRTYTVTYMAVDAAGNQGFGSATVEVPHDAR